MGHTNSDYKNGLGPLYIVGGILVVLIHNIPIIALTANAFD